MKKISLLFLISCGGSNETKTNTSSTTVSGSTMVSEAEYRIKYEEYHKSFDVVDILGDGRYKVNGLEYGESCGDRMMYAQVDILLKKDSLTLIKTCTF